MFTSNYSWRTIYDFTIDPTSQTNTFLLFFFVEFLDLLSWLETDWDFALAPFPDWLRCFGGAFSFVTDSKSLWNGMSITFGLIVKRNRQWMLNVCLCDYSSVARSIHTCIVRTEKANTRKRWNKRNRRLWRSRMRTSESEWVIVDWTVSWVTVAPQSYSLPESKRASNKRLIAQFICVCSTIDALCTPVYLLHSPSSIRFILENCQCPVREECVYFMVVCIVHCFAVVVVCSFDCSVHADTHTQAGRQQINICLMAWNENRK